MGWNDLDKGSGQKAPILRASDCTKPTRIRLLVGPGKKYEEPYQVFQHWGPEGQKFPPFACGDSSGKNCMFHEEPYAWRVNKINLMHAIVYTPNAQQQWEGTIMVLQAPATLLTQIRDQSRMTNVDPTTVDWIISKTGQGKEGTKYHAVMAPGGALHPTLNIADWPAQEADIALAASPQFVDYDKIDGFKIMSADEQEKVFDQILQNKESKNSKDAPPGVAPAAAAAAPPPPVQAAPPPAAVAPPPVAAQPPAAPPAAPPPAAPPAAPAPAAIDPRIAAGGLADPWGRGQTMSQLRVDELQFIVDNEPSFAAFPNQLQAAKILLQPATAAAPAPAAAPVAAPPPAAAAPATAGAGTKERMNELMQSMPVFQELTNVRKFFEKVTGIKALGKMTPEQIGQCIAIAEQGDAAVLATING